MPGGKNLLAECYGDTLLVKQAKYEYLPYHGGIGQVANVLKKYYANKIAVALIDNDKGSIPSYFTNDIIEIERSEYLILRKHRKEKHYFILVNRGCEDFIEAAAIKAGVTKEKHKLPKGKSDFRKLIKSKDLHSNSRAVNFFNEIVQKNPPQIELLKKFIRYGLDDRFSLV